MYYKGACHARRGGHHQRHYAKKWMKHQFKAHFSQPPVNIEELDDQYEIYIYAAGYAKNDFSVGLKDNILVISAEKANIDEMKGKNWKRLEFKPRGFERRFELNEKIDKEVIVASYEEGVLKVTLPKLSGAETFRQDIEVN